MPAFDVGRGHERRRTMRQAPACVLLHQLRLWRLLKLLASHLIQLSAEVERYVGQGRASGHLHPDAPSRAADGRSRRLPRGLRLMAAAAAAASAPTSVAAAAAAAAAAAVSAAAANAAVVSAVAHTYSACIGVAAGRPSEAAWRRCWPLLGLPCPQDQCVHGQRRSRRSRRDAVGRGGRCAAASAGCGAQRCHLRLQRRDCRRVLLRLCGAAAAVRAG